MISERLKTIGVLVRHDTTVADIGADHGLLAVYLLESTGVRNVIMSDISSGSLEKGRRLCSASPMTEYMEFRLGDGLSVLRDGEADSVVIAGMGGRLIAAILSADEKKSCSFKRFVLQPRNGQGILRKWLSENGFEICEERPVREGTRIAEIIVATPPKYVGQRFEAPCESGEGRGRGPIEYRLPARLFRENGELAAELAEAMLKENAEIRRDIEKSGGGYDGIISELEKEDRYIWQLISEK